MIDENSDVSNIAFKNADGTSDASALSEVKPFTFTPSAPNTWGVKGVSLGVDLTWDAVTGATDYKVYYRTTAFNNTSDADVLSKEVVTFPLYHPASPPPWSCCA